VGQSTEPRPAWLPPHVLVVHSFAELLATPFAGEHNAVCWPRALAGDFAAVAAAIAAGCSDDLLPVDAAALDSLSLAPAGRRAVATLQADLDALRAAGHQPSLDVIRRYARDDDALLAENFGELAVRERFLRVLGTDELLDQRANRRC